MKKRVVKGIVMALCLTMLMPGMAYATGNGSSDNTTSTSSISIEDVRKEAKETLQDYKLFLEPNEKEAEKLDTIISNAASKIAAMNTDDMIKEYVIKVKADMLNVTDPVEDDEEDEDEDEETTTTTASEISLVPTAA